MLSSIPKHAIITACENNSFSEGFLSLCQTAQCLARWMPNMPRNYLQIGSGWLYPIVVPFAFNIVTTWVQTRPSRPAKGTLRTCTLPISSFPPSGYIKGHFEMTDFFSDFLFENFVRASTCCAIEVVPCKAHGVHPGPPLKVTRGNSPAWLLPQSRSAQSHNLGKTSSAPRT